MYVLLLFSSCIGPYIDNFYLVASDDSPEQLVRNREIAAQVFGPNGAPKFGPAMLQPQYCGKWLVRYFVFILQHIQREISVLGNTAHELEDGPYKQSPRLHQVCEVAGDARISSTITRHVPNALVSYAVFIAPVIRYWFREARWCYETSRP